MTKSKTALRASLSAIGVLVAATAAALDPQEFVTGWPIETPPSADVFDVPLTAEVYAAAASVEQIAVLDANGAPLSFFRRTTPPARVERRVVLEASPVYAARGVGDPTIDVSTNERGTSVTVTPGAANDPAAAGFVLDARSLDVAPSALELEWRAEAQPFLLEVRVEQSADLTDWHRVGGGAVAALAIGGAEVRHTRVPVRASAGGYYRITPSRAVANWHLVRAALVSGESPPAESLTVSVPPLQDEALPQDRVAEALYFDAGGVPPIVAVSLEFDGDAGWTRADVAASESLDGPWQPVAHAALFYSLRFESTDFTSPPLAVGRRELRYWRLLPDATARSQRPTLVLTFPQEYLRVGANGAAAPLLLVAGTLAEEAGPDATFASVWTDLEPEPRTVPLASIGARRTLGGAAALAAPRELPWRTLALWATLIGGVLVVGAMAVRLAREMRHQPS
jgi:hypothetical protein